MTLKELQNDVDDLRAEAIEAYERLRKKGRTWLIVAGVALVLAVILLFTVFKPKPNNAEVDNLRQVINEQMNTIRALEQVQAAQDSALKRLDEKYSENRKTETKIIYRYEQIPVTVRDLNREQLRNEVANY